MAQFFKTAVGQDPFSTEKLVGDYVLSYPLGAKLPTAIQVRAPFNNIRGYYQRPAVNSVLYYGDSTLGNPPVTLYFCDDVNFRDRGAGVTEYTRIWSSIPASWSDYESYAYEYPGYLPQGSFNVTGSNATNKITFTIPHNLATADPIVITFNSGFGGLTTGTIYYSIIVDSLNIKLATTVANANSGTAITLSSSGTTGFLTTLQVGRIAYVYTVTSKLTYDYFLIDPGGSYTNAGAVPVYFGQRYYYGSSASASLAGAINTPAQYSFLTNASQVSSGTATSAIMASSPSLATYKGWVTTDAATPTSYSIEANDSTIEQYAGNIYRRTRRFVKAI